MKQAINVAVHAAIAFLALTCICMAQVPFNPGDAAAPRFGYPEPNNPLNWKGVLAPQQCPDGSLAPLNTCGDGRDGFVRGWDSFNQHMELRPPKILPLTGAISAASSMGGSLSLTQNAWNNLYGSIGAHGFRPGLTAYIPVGNYAGSGNVSIATGSTSNPAYTVRVLMGTCRKSSGSQKGILIVPGADGSITTNGATPAGAVNGVNNVLSFAATTCIAPGMTVYDVTHPGAVAAQIVVCSVAATTVTLTSATAYPACTASGFVSAPGVSNGDTFIFSYVIGYGGAKTWPGGAGLAEIVPYIFTTFANVPCLAAQNSYDQCEVLTQVFTTGTGDSIQTAGGAITNPPYPTNLIGSRIDGGYGAQ